MNALLRCVRCVAITGRLRRGPITHHSAEIMAFQVEDARAEKLPLVLEEPAGRLCCATGQKWIACIAGFVRTDITVQVTRGRA